MVPILLAVFGCSGPGSYPSPSEAGFHHAALIYGKAERGVRDLEPYAAEFRDGSPRRWMFDAFLFLIRNLPSGAITEVDPTRKPDWDYHLDQWFQQGRDLHALDEAIEGAARTLGRPPSKRKIVLSVPYPHPDVREFGDVDGDGRSEDLGSVQGRRTVLRWYVGEAVRRFREAGFRHLELWGFYWMREDLHGSDGERLRDLADVVHQRGLRVLWIPYYNAPGWTAWREAGIDVCIRQPNYAFWAGRHEGSVRANRLMATADQARSAGAGIEIEAGQVLSSRDDRRAFLQYLAEGAPDRSAYQNGAMAYYLGTDVVERSARSAIAEVRRVYVALAEFVAGERLPDPDPPVEPTVALPAEWGSSGGLGLKLATPSVLADLELYLEEGTDPWRGLVEAEARTRDGWAPAGWAVRASSDRGSGSHQVIVVPIQREAGELRLRWSGRGRAVLARVGVRLGAPAEIRPHGWVGEPYAIEPPAGEARYPDSGGLLTDGLVASDGFRRGASVGWLGGSVRILVDLGHEVSVDEVRLHCHGGGAAGIGWPEEAAVAVSNERISQLQGLGAPSRGLRVLSEPSIVVRNRRSETDESGALVFRPPAAVRGRHLLLSAKAAGWLMADELEVRSGGRNVALGRPYLLFPHPTAEPVPEKIYPDDGIRLTDGRIAQDFQPGLVAAWRDVPLRTVRIRPGKPVAVREVSVWALAGGRHGILSPARVTVGLRDASGRWTRVSAVSDAQGPEDGSSCRPVRHVAQLPTPIAAVEAEVAIEGRPGGWVAVSEVEAR